MESASITATNLHWTLRREWETRRCSPPGDGILCIICKKCCAPEFEQRSHRQSMTNSDFPISKFKPAMKKCRYSQSSTDLRQQVQKVWNNVSRDILRDLYDSVHARTQICFHAEAGYIIMVSEWYLCNPLFWNQCMSYDVYLLIYCYPTVLCVLLNLKY